MATPALVFKVLMPGLLGFGLVWLFRPSDGPNAHTPSVTKEIPAATKPVIFAEKMDDATARELLLDPNVERPQRNEAANRLRSDKPEEFLEIVDTILNRDNETDLFKSWMLQHVGNLGKKMSEPQAVPWINRLQRIVTTKPVSSPMWREGIFALASFRQPSIRAWIGDYVKTLNPEQYQKNEFLIRELLAPPSKKSGIYSEGDLKNGPL